MSNPNKQPDFIAFTVRNYGEDQTSWTRIGVGWQNSDKENVSDLSQKKRIKLI